jgi:plastocyanin
MAALVVAATLLVSACGDDPNDAAGGQTNVKPTTATTAAAPTTAAQVETTTTVAATTTTVSSSNQIGIKDFAFIPSVIAVKTGTTVSWTNNDTAKHQIVITDLNFSGDALAKGDTSKETFNQSGTFAYFCGIHNAMTGTIQVSN